MQAPGSAGDPASGAVRCPRAPRESPRSRFHPARTRAPGACRSRRRSAGARARRESGRPSVEESLAWAQEATRRHPVAGRYRPVAPVWYWGRMLEAPSSIPLAARRSRRGTAVEPRARARVAEMRRRPRPREATEDEDDDRLRDVGDSRGRTAGERRRPIRSSTPGRSRRDMPIPRGWRIRCPSCRKRASSRTAGQAA